MARKKLFTHGKAITVTLSADTLARIEGIMWLERIGSRVEVIRLVVERGLVASRRLTPAKTITRRPLIPADVQRRSFEHIDREASKAFGADQDFG
jgi:hypothetical protein